MKYSEKAIISVHVWEVDALPRPWYHRLLSYLSGRPASLALTFDATVRKLFLLTIPRELPDSAALITSTGDGSSGPRLVELASATPVDIPDAHNVYIVSTTNESEIIYFGSQEVHFEVDRDFVVTAYPELPLHIFEYLTTYPAFTSFDEYSNVLYEMYRTLTKGCDALFVTFTDDCNTCRRYMRALETTGLTTFGIKSQPHPFEYGDEMLVAKTLEYPDFLLITEQFPTILDLQKNGALLQGLIKSVKFVHLHNTSYCLINGSEPDFTGTVLFGSHTGSVYRFQSEKVNSYFNSRFDEVICQSTDLYGRGAANEHLIHYAVDTTNITPDISFKRDDALVVGHFPSTTVIKGSPVINEAMSLVQQIFPGRIDFIGARGDMDDLNKSSSHRVTWQEQLAKYKTCDIYIETLNPGFCLGNPAYPEISQREPFGEWGNTCLEACASGCLVISNSLFADTYEAEYGVPPGFIVANSKDELVVRLLELLLASRDEITSLKQQCVDWASNHHSIEKTGERLYAKMYEKYL